MDEQARTEQLRKQELASQLDDFRKAQYDAEIAGNNEFLEAIPKVEDVVVGGWSASGRKRKKISTQATAAGSKIRKMGNAPSQKPEPTKSKPTDSKPAEPSSAPPSVDKKPKQEGMKKEEKATEAPLADEKPKSTSVAKPGMMGLVTYSSDEDEE